MVKIKANVVGIDLTPELVEVSRKLTHLVGLNIKFKIADEIDIPYQDSSFDIATLIHVGMNLKHKKRLFSEV